MLAIIYDSAHVDFWFLIINDTQIKKKLRVALQEGQSPQNGTVQKIS